MNKTPRKVRLKEHQEYNEREMGNKEVFANSLKKVSTTEFMFSTVTTTTVCTIQPMDKGIGYVVVVEFGRR
jgi:hypothetical protein